MRALGIHIALTMNQSRIYIIVIGLFVLIEFIVSLYIVNRIGLINDRLDRANMEYQMVIEDDSLILFDRNRLVGCVKLEGQLDSLVIMDNQ